MTLANTAITLATIVGAADLLIEMEEKERAADVLAFVLAQDEASPATRERAWDLFDELEAELCPRVIWDARERAQTATLQQILMLLDDL
jgi:hypothetical protein